MDRLFVERQRLEKKAQQLKQERDKSWLPVYKDLRDNISPNDGQFEGDITNDGSRKDRRVNNPKPLRSAERLAAGMASGLTSKSRPWFELMAPQSAQDTVAVRRWLYQVQTNMRTVLAQSNLYNVLPQVYHSQGVYGTAAMAALPDRDKVVRFTHYPCGTYCLATNDKGQVDTFYRCYSMTPRQMVQRFGEDSVSPQTKLAAKQGDNIYINVHHLVEPNPDADMRYVDNRSMPYKSSYWEDSINGANKGILRQSGFRHFPIMAPRWLVNGTNVYGTGPGHISLGKCRELQLLEADKMRLVQQLARPNRTAPVSLKAGGGANMLPGGVTWVPDGQVGLALKPTYVPDPAAIPNVRAEIAECEQDIGEAFFEDLFLMITQLDGQMTAYEIARRQEEKVAMLGPVIERNDEELLDKIVESTFTYMLEQSEPIWSGLMPGEPLIPPPPEELQDMQIDIEYISVLAQAQKAVATGSIERGAQFVTQLVGAGFQDAADKFNSDAAIDEYFGAIGAPPTTVRGEDEVAQIRQARAAQMAQQAAQEQGMALAQGAKTLAETPTDGDTALSAIMGGGQA